MFIPTWLIILGIVALIGANRRVPPSITPAKSYSADGEWVKDASGWHWEYFSNRARKLAKKG